MTKIIVHLTKIIIATITAILFSSCGMGISGSGNVVTQSRNADAEFTSVSAGSGIEVIIEQQANSLITVEADDNLHEHIKTEIKNGELSISTDVNIRKASSKRVIVSMPVIKGIEASSGADVKTKNTITGESLELFSSSGSHLEVTANVKNISAHSNSGSHLTIKGSTDTLESDSSSGSHIVAKELAAKTVNAQASSGGHTTVNPKDELLAEASSGGHIYYVNTPAKLDKNTSSGGNVSED